MIIYPIAPMREFAMKEPAATDAGSHGHFASADARFN
jgi:hypothetical protein